MRFALLTQFSALVDKALVKICDQRYFDATWESNDIAYLKGSSAKNGQKLKTLNKGEFIYQCKGVKELIKTQEYKRPQRAPVTN